MRNLSIIGKFLSILAVSGAFALGVAGYAAYQIKHIDTVYNDVFDQEATAALYSARANRALQASRAAIGDLLIARTKAANTSASDDLRTQHDNFIKFIDIAIAALPSYKDAPLLKADSLALLDNTCANAISLAKQSTTPDQIAASEDVFMRECQPGFAALSPRFIQMVTSISDASSKKRADLTLFSDQTVLLTLVGVCGGLAVVLLMGFFAIRSWLVLPIRRLAETMGVLAGGNLSVIVDEADRRDEVGTMAKAVQVFKDNGLKAEALAAEADSLKVEAETSRHRTVEADRLRADAMAKATSGLGEGLKHLAGGDLTFHLSDPFAEEFETLRNDFNVAVGQLSETLRAVAEATSALDTGSREVSASAEDLSKRTEQQAASLEETAAALDQITVNVANSSKRADEARKIAVLANESAAHSGRVVTDAVGAMQKIEHSSNEISSIIGVIDEIAFQTNLLALNAGVEAARAGDAGRGFAVVAQEVRELAQRSAKAAKEIKDLIRNSSVDVQNGVKLVSETGEALTTIGGYIVTVNQHMDSIATSAKEQSVGLAEVNTAVNQMDQVTQQNAAMVEETSAAGASLASESGRLRELIAGFQLGGVTRQTSAVMVANSGHRPVQSPVRRLAGKVVKAFSGNVAVKESWEEF